MNTSKGWIINEVSRTSFARVSKTTLIKKDDFIKLIGELDVIDFENIVKKFIEYNS